MSTSLTLCLMQKAWKMVTEKNLCFFCDYIVIDLYPWIKADFLIPHFCLSSVLHMSAWLLTQPELVL